MNFGKCTQCGKKAVIALNAGELPLCAYHYVKQGDEECLKALLLHEIFNYGKIDEQKEIQLEIKRQRPKLYEQLKQYFSF